MEPGHTSASHQLPAPPAASPERQPSARLGGDECCPQCSAYQHSGGQIPALLPPPPSLIRQMDPSVPLSALTYFSLSCLPESLGCLTHRRCGDAVPAHTHPCSPGGKLTLHLKYGGGLQLFPLPSCDLFLTEANKYLKQLPSDHLQHAGNGSPMFLYRMVVSGQTGSTVWEDCWLRNPSVLSWISILPLSDSQEGWIWTEAFLMVSMRVTMRCRGHWRQLCCQMQAGPRDPKAPRQHKSGGSQGKPEALQRSPSWAGIITRSLGQATSPGYSCGRLKHMAGAFLRLPERSPITHPVVAPAGTHNRQQTERQEGNRRHQRLYAVVPWLGIKHAKPALNSPTVFKLPIDGKGNCWRKEVILTAFLAVFDLCHTVILGNYGHEMLCKQLLLCLSYGKCSSSAPHNCTWSGHGLRGHSLASELPVLQEAGSMEILFFIVDSTLSGAIPSSRFGFSVERGGKAGWKGGKDEISFQDTHIKRWEMALKCYVVIYPNIGRIHRDGLTRSLWVFAPVPLRAGHWHMSWAAGTEPSLWRIHPGLGLISSCWEVLVSGLSTNTFNRRATRHSKA